MNHTIQISTSISLRVKAKERYSTEKINIVAGEEYEFRCDEEECWVDWFIPATPNRVYNPFASLVGLRVKKALCFCLCGSYNDKEECLFAIGGSKKIEMEESGTLSFFANDATSYYGNNRGIITVHVKRIK